MDIAKAAIEHAKANQQNVVLIDTAGRLHVDEDMNAGTCRYQGERFR